MNASLPDGDNTEMAKAKSSCLSCGAAPSGLSKRRLRQCQCKVSLFDSVLRHGVVIRGQRIETSQSGYRVDICNNFHSTE